MSSVPTNDRVEGWLDTCRRLLPIQNPLWAFIHNNTLLNWESLPFDEAVRRAGALYGARPYESESFFCSELERGRIRADTLEAVLAQLLPAIPAPRIPAFLAQPALGDTVDPVTSLRLAPRLQARFDAPFDRHLQDLLVPLVSTYLDQGMAPWRNPYQGRSFWAFFRDAVLKTPRWTLAWQGDLVERLRAAEARGDDPASIVCHEVETARVLAGREADYCVEVLFTLKGWSGMAMRLEADPALAPVQAPPIRLVEWLAALLVTSHALEAYLLRKQGMTRAQALTLPAELPSTRGLGRLRIWQEAYERSFAVEFLGHLEQGLVPDHPVSPDRPAFQALTCMDDREESFRRALESPGCGVQTWGVVGFFGIDMRFSAVGSARPTRQCPPVVEPSRTVQEQPLEGEDKRVKRVMEMGRVGASARLSGFYQSRTLLRGIVFSLLLGWMSFVPMVLRLVWPARVEKARAALRRRVFPHPRTRIGLDLEGGYSPEEQAGIVENVLRTCGLTRAIAPVVAIVGHGSTSTNNPFRQAYGCGACSGNPGAPNARAWTQMANDPQVRSILAGRGLVLPTDTWFVPVLHDTVADTVEFLDPEAVPPTHRAQVAELRRRLEAACVRNADERARRLEQASQFGGTTLQHVSDRAHDLAQPRPEYGHNRVAACIVGRRDLTRTTFLDRRTFLVSYDPTQDTDGSLLRSAVLGSVPVAVNIAMDYYFSRVDPDGFGAGTKLPLNVTSLLGVMTGSKSDLRIGLARQMVELHEPMRHLVLIEATQEHLDALVDGNRRLTQLLQGRWMRLGRIDPRTREVTVWDSGRFAPWREVWTEARPVPQGSPSCLPSILDVRGDRCIEVAA